MRRGLICIVDPGVLISAVIGPAGSSRIASLGDRRESEGHRRATACGALQFPRWFGLDEPAAKQLIERMELHATIHPDPPCLRAQRATRTTHARITVATLDAPDGGQREAAALGRRPLKREPPACGGFRQRAPEDSNL